MIGVRAGPSPVLKARRKSDRTLYRFYHVPNAYLAGLSRQTIASARTLDPLNQPRVLQRPEELSHVIRRNTLSLCDFAARYRSVAVMAGQVDHSSQGIPSSC